jgi:hypothetical protein
VLPLSLLKTANGWCAEHKEAFYSLKTCPIFATFFKQTTQPLDISWFFTRRKVCTIRIKYDVIEV